MKKPKGNSGDGKAATERLERELEEARQCFAKAEAKLADQSVRLEALGSGREETMRLLAEVRRELRRVAAERDDLQKRLTAIEGMQTETVAYSEPEDAEPPIHQVLPSINELMASLNSAIQEGGGRARLSGQAAEQPDPDWQEMIPPEVIAPDRFREGEDAAGTRLQRLLVYVDGQNTIRYPLYKEVMTIGRSEGADIQIDGEFISRIHARIVSMGDGALIEDAGSKNGIKVNGQIVRRQDLKHGDVIAVGNLRFTFVEIRVRT